MTKIEEALAKLRATPASSRPSRVPAHLRAASGEEGPREGTGGAPAHAYGGRKIHLDVPELQAQRVLPQGTHERRLADEFRSIKRPLLRNAMPGGGDALERGNLWMVTSALAGEGKTFTCMNLCLSVAKEKDWSVVLVDGDCSKPQLTQLLGATRELGLMDLLRDSRLAFDSVVMPTDVPGLSFLPAGKSDEHAAEHLASARMKALCEELASSDQRRIVVFDSAPILMTAEAPVLGLQVGQVILVVQADKTPEQAVLDARDRLDPAVPTCLLLNKANARESTVAQGGYYSQQGPAD
jgi:exopolysaccharide/PEP-CTERM locus tyrosine autokinase